MDNFKVSDDKGGLNESLIASIIASSVVVAQNKIFRQLELYTIHTARTYIQYKNLSARESAMLGGRTPDVHIGFLQKVRLVLGINWGSQYQEKVNDAAYHNWWGFAFLARGIDTNHPKWFYKSVAAFKIAHEQEAFGYGDLYQLHPFLELARHKKDFKEIIAKATDIYYKLKHDNSTPGHYRAKGWRVLAYIYHGIYQNFKELPDPSRNKKTYYDLTEEACGDAKTLNASNTTLVEQISRQLNFLKEGIPLQFDPPKLLFINRYSIVGTVFLFVLSAMLGFSIFRVSAHFIYILQTEQWSPAKIITIGILFVIIFGFTWGSLWKIKAIISNTWRKIVFVETGPPGTSGSSIQSKREPDTPVDTPASTVVTKQGVIAIKSEMQHGSTVEWKSLESPIFISALTGNLETINDLCLQHAAVITVIQGRLTIECSDEDWHYTISPSEAKTQSYANATIIVTDNKSRFEYVVNWYGIVSVQREAQVF